ncbi:hypothetical protein SAMN05444671_1228 [Flavobacterium sp. CF108]|uniref:hypothetical protein n=1 Tax=unclassified Flavobacterium TaxID=196869 RepID=UPI0008CA8277|nr:MULTISPECIES: hypothetical protein [unclassified Flavobacterium]SEO85280.1 hypothetical protein SAMN04487978_3825 [Flavobacterium sp. fv08]SHG70022.1 hypothetical protein SAMN05444671_1228 [Flavobacterium sp. CF108]
MNVLKILFLVVVISNSYSITAQKINPIDTLHCPISQNELLLDKKSFASAPPILLRVFNEDFEYAVLQLGKRKRKIYLYFKIFTDNVCVKQKQPLVLYFKTGEKYVLKNSFSVNCDGTAALQLTRGDRKKIMANNINTIRFFTLKKDYEFSPNSSDNQNLKEYLNCLKLYKIKKL